MKFQRERERERERERKRKKERERERKRERERERESKRKKKKSVLYCESSPLIFFIDSQEQARADSEQKRIQSLLAQQYEEELKQQKEEVEGGAFLLTINSQANWQHTHTHTSKNNNNH